MELLFLLLLIIIMALALGSGFPVAFALPGSAILSIIIAALCGYLFTGSVDTYFHTGSPSQWLSAGVTNLRGVYWEVERDTLIAIPLFIFMGIMLQRSKIAEDLLVTMAQLFGKIPGGLGISVVFVGALLAATTGIVGATVVAMGLISLPAMTTVIALDILPLSTSIKFPTCSNVSENTDTEKSASTTKLIFFIIPLCIQYYVYRQYYY